MLTEDEAKTKWCPFVRMLPLAIDETYQEATSRECPDGKCIGSACMAWRWNEDQMEHKATRSPKGEPMKPPAGEGWSTAGDAYKEAHSGHPGDMIQTWVRVTPNRQGLCGLAGAAQLTLNTEPMVSE